MSEKEALEYEKINNSKDIVTPEQIKLSSKANGEEKKHNKLLVFFGISLVLSYLIITEGNFFFAWWLLFAIPFFALWLTAPVFFSDDDDDNKYVFFGYIVWVAIQWAIYYFGIGPPEGIGVPHF